MTELQKLEYIHFVLQEAQNYYEGMERELNPEILSAIDIVEELREPHL